MPISGKIPINRLFLLGQRVNVPVRTVNLSSGGSGTLPREHSFLKVEGKAVVTSIQRKDDKIQVRLFNPHTTKEKIEIKPSTAYKGAKCLTLSGLDDKKTKAVSTGDAIEAVIPGKRITTVVIEL